LQLQFGTRDYFSLMLSDLLKLFVGNRQPDTATSHEVLGIPVVVYNTRPDIDTNAVIARLERSLALVERYVPHHFRHVLFR